jgi:hypothetical protein
MNKFQLDDRVEGGETPEDHERGTVLAIDGDQITVGWDSHIQTTQDAALLRRIGD